MAHDVAARPAGGAARHGRPQLARLVVDQVDPLRRGVDHRVVRERRQPVLAAVLGPGERRARRRDDRAELRVGDDVRPRPRRLGAALQHDHVLAAGRGEAAASVLEPQLRHRDLRRLGGRRRDVGAHARGRPLRLGIRPVELVREVPAVARQHGPRDRRQQHPLALGDDVAAQQVDAARPRDPRGPGTALDQRRERAVHLVAIAHRVLVQHHHVGEHALEAPVLLRLQDLAHQGQVVLLHHAHQQDRQVARDAVRPQPGLAALVALAQRGLRAQRGVGVHHARRQALEELRLVAGQAEVPQRDLGVGEGERQRARARAGVVVLLRQRVRGGGALRDAGREREAREAAGRQPDPVAQAQHRIEHGAGRARERPPVERLRVVGLASAAQEARAVALPFDGRTQAALDAQHVHRVELGLLRRARTPPAQEGGVLGLVGRLQEELAERRMGRVVLRAAQDGLDVARDLDLARAVAAVRERDPAHLHVVLGRHRHLEARLDLVVVPAEHRPLGREVDHVVVGLAARRLIGGRPDGAARHVAQVHVVPARVRGRVRPQRA